MMMKRILIVAVLLVVVAVPGQAQIVVTDPGNLAQAILIAERTLREYETLWGQYQTILRMARQHDCQLPGRTDPRQPPQMR